MAHMNAFEAGFSLSLQIGAQPGRHFDFGLVKTLNREPAESMWATDLLSRQLITGPCFKPLGWWGFALQP